MGLFSLMPLPVAFPIFVGRIFGPPYIALFGLDKLLSAPAFKVELLSEGTVYMQLAESLFDLHADPGRVRDIRSRIRSHLDNNIFFDPAAPAEHAYRRPRFLSRRGSTYDG